MKDLWPATLLRKRLWHRCFPLNFAKFLRTPFLQNTSGRLLLFFEKKCQTWEPWWYLWNYCNFSLTNKKTVYRLDLQLPTAKQLDFTYTYWITWWWTNINHGVDGKPINGSKQWHYFGRCRFCHVNPPWTELQNGYYKY